MGALFLPWLRIGGRAGLALAFFLLANAAGAVVDPSEKLDDPVLEQRARAISKELRCMVCQNQSIDDSDAGLAKDMRIFVRERLRDGDTDPEVIDAVVERYGDFALLRPPVKPQTYALWFGPLIILAVGAVAVWRFVRRPAGERDAGVDAMAARAGQGLSEAERERLNAVLKDDEAGSR